MPLVEDEHGIVVREAAAFFKPHGLLFFKVADEIFRVVPAFVHEIGEFTKQRRQVYLFILSEVIVDDFQRANENWIVDFF